MDSSVLEEVELQKQDTDTGQGRTHIVNIPMNPHLWMPGMKTSQDVVNAARVRGVAVNTLCGTSFIPNKDPERFPVCEACMDIAQRFISEDEG